MIAPEWGAPAAVGAAMSTRAGGAGGPPFDTLNLGTAVGDDAAVVAENRRRFAAAIGARPVWLHQVHGVRVVRVGAADAAEGAAVIEADAALTCEPGVACVVTVADCLPLLFAAADGRVVGAAHAGWRGLAGGVAEATLRAVAEAAGCGPSDVHVWLGPCIGPRRFEVGADVLRALGAAPQQADRPHFRWAPRPDGSARWLADLQAIARERLFAAGATRVTGGETCTASDPSRFFSFRRDGVTGRHAAAVWRRG